MHDPIAAEPRLTPAGFSETAVLARRRVLMLILCAASYGAVLFAVGLLLGDGGVGGPFFSGWTTLDVALFLCVALSAPWTILGFCNAVIGLLLLFGRRETGDWTDALQRVDHDAPLEGRTAVAMTIRNEDPDRAYARLLAIRASLDATGFGDRFDLFVLSDSSDRDVAAAEAALFARLRGRLEGAGGAHYRRRADNEGFKAGNVRDFLEKRGDGYTYFAPLDADSVVSGQMLVAFAQFMEARPRLGILQSLAVGAPNASGFGRLFQFGMRHGMRSFTAGSAWWQGDCGPFWGHNALVRVAPFKQACALPVLPGGPPLGGHILSHDQVEAVLMRRAGYEVRVAPIETESFEENPPTILDFIKREERWCNGNMQYFPLLATPGLQPLSRLQLAQAILMYVASPAWMLLTIFAALKPFEAAPQTYNAALGIGLFAVMFLLSLAPKLAGAVAVAASPGGFKRYGGVGRFSASFLLEVLFSMLIAPVVAFRVSVFMLGLAVGRRIQWSGQNRDAYGLSWRAAAQGLWGATAYGLLIGGLLAVGAPGVLPWAAPVLIGLIFAIPVAVLTAAPRFGRLLRRARIAATPEEIAPDALLEAVEREAAALTGKRALALAGRAAPETAAARSTPRPA